MMSLACLRSNFDSFFVLGSISVKSSTRCLNLPAMPREQTTRVRCLFFHSLDAGSGSLNACRPSSSSSPASLCTHFSSWPSTTSSRSFSLSEARWAMFDRSSSCFWFLAPLTFATSWTSWESSDSLLSISSTKIFLAFVYFDFALLLRFLKTEAMTKIMINKCKNLSFRNCLN